MNTLTSPIETTRQAWNAVCERRGIRQPEPTKSQAFLRELEPDALHALNRAIRQCMGCGESPTEMKTVSWASACTRADFLQKANAMCPGCTGAALFAAGLILIPQGWDMSAKIYNLHSSPKDIIELSEVLATLSRAETTPENGGAPGPAPDHGSVQPAATPDRENAHSAQAQTATHAFDLFLPKGQPPPTAARVAAPAGMAASQPQNNDGVKREDGQDPEHGDDQDAPPPHQSGSRPKARIFGKDAAHSIEISNHRRADDFMNVSVVTVDSARALASGGYDWRNKLVIQLTPEEMPAAIAVLMGLIPNAKFDHHGSDKSKFLEMRNQEGGMMVVTGHRATSFAVPIKTPGIYYLLDLFCRAMAAGTPNRSGTEVMTLIRSIYA